ncbi:T9SS-dependent M36 family metallopeptidase [Ulvibacter litoralis]|uniref:Por secretion system C-terminal sorting domain-containing protein n=1 Tax=Ulvibacter litoralis TaxID=227084 RepID=A0A1G7DPU1_9FLAO|nr:T9SS-dependent M36 family metallopeptidase [Ulvibacter litoralis]GHC42868.1 peptidase M36 [Ulvibacter litoralis]SDE52835.1 Por secretion system C-terminal sorting domain-containing protein [Ulvibacter litoralis]
MKKALFLLAFITVSVVSAQDYSSVISSYLSSNRAELGLQPQDIGEIEISSQSFSKSMELDVVYVNQVHQGIEVFNSTSTFAIRNGNVVNANLSFTENISQKVNATNPSNTAMAAIATAASSLGIQAPSNLQVIETVGAHSYVYSNGSISLENIPVKLVYQTTEDNNLRLAWDLSIYLLDGSHYYSVRVDAVTGALLSTHDWVVSCSVNSKAHTNHASHTNEVAARGQSILFQDKAPTNLELLAGEQYRVFPIPVESPSHGSDELVIEPADATASPFGWHDFDGVAGDEFTITRGNNVWAQEDADGNNGVGYSPDGGATLDFDFAFNFNTSPGNMRDAAITNLFYMNNILHDVLYQYGFDEEAGNFQQNNYGNPGNGNDYVIAEAQDGSGTDNANFATPPDGQRPRMQMFLWTASGPAGEPLTINNGPLAGDYTGIPANFGPPLPATPITEDLVVVLDDDSGVSTDPTDACDVITNGGALSGKIAVIRRGECEFGFKVLAAQNAGAVAAIVVNNEAGAPIIMGPGVNGGDVTIPSIMVSQADGEAFITELASATVNGSIFETGPYMLDGDVDNGIVAHEYGHGVSNRLTAGPTNVGCLQNAEQMGEGWSDYIGLMLTMEQGDLGPDVRGIGTYATGEPITGTGIRTYPYSTDLTVNPHTYDNIKTESVPHGVGSVWTAMLWEMTWDLIDANGGTIGDIYTGTAGNNIALQLVMDGMKLQPCNPGFEDGRDAILLADRLNNGGANQCLIWEAFARRGMGLSASQGSSASRSDGTEAFDVPTTPGCLLSTADTKLDNNFAIYPNPSNGNINISSVVDAGDVTVSIVDLNGRVVFTQNVELHTSVNINAENLNTGIYVVQIEGVNYAHTAKLIIE